MPHAILKSKVLLMGDEKPDPRALRAMRTSPANHHGTQWAAYQCVDLLSAKLGHLQFIAIGPWNTLQVAPWRAPNATGYELVGMVDLDTGGICQD